MIKIVAEQPSDVQAIYALNNAAFGQPGEARLVDLLRNAGALTISLTAVDASEIVGHIAFSPVEVHGHEQVSKALALAPMAVAPHVQRRGIGSQLVKAGLQACEETGLDLVIVLGHPEFYPRFGFKQARPFGIECPYPVPDEVFMVYEIYSGAARKHRGMVKYHEAFASL